jgi:hypothetical protein
MCHICLIKRQRGQAPFPTSIVIAAMGSMSSTRASSLEASERDGGRQLPDSSELRFGSSVFSALEQCLDFVMVAEESDVQV